MRELALLAVASLVLGCASKKSTSIPAPVAQLAQPSAALAFDPPVAYLLPEYVLARNFRQQAAYVGYDQTITTFSYIETDDRQYHFDKFNDFERRAYSGRSTVSYR
jgi:hypothetical protein